MNGLAITIIVGQLPKLCGFSTEAEAFVEEVREFLVELRSARYRRRCGGADDARGAVGLPRLTRKVPAVLVAVVGATVVTGLLSLDIGTVGVLPEGLPRPAVPWTGLGDVVPLLIAAVGITLVSLTDTIALSTSFNARRGEAVQPDQEMIGIGTANVAAGFFQGFAVSSSSSRTAVAEQAGAATQLTGVVGAGVVVLLLLFFNGLLANLPNAALAAVVIAAALSLVELRRPGPGLEGAALGRRALARRPRRRHVRRRTQGILVAVVLSILLFFKRNWWPHGEVLGQVAGARGGTAAAVARR